MTQFRLASHTRDTKDLQKLVARQHSARDGRARTAIRQWPRVCGLRLDRATVICVVARIMPSQLHEACIQGNLDVVAALHNGGACVNTTTTDFSHSSPLNLACLYGHLELAQWLHSVGASLDATDLAGETPLHIACGRGRLDVAQ